VRSARAGLPLPDSTNERISGVEHSAFKGNTRLFLWEKYAGRWEEARGAIVFVHGSSFSSQATFDLAVPGRVSAMDYFAARNYDTWCVDMEGYGRSDKPPAARGDVVAGADDLLAAAKYIQQVRGWQRFHLYGSSSGALRAGVFAQRHPEFVGRLVLDAFVWTGEGSVTLAQRRQNLARFVAEPRRPVNRRSIEDIFTRDHPGVVAPEVIDAVSKAVLALDDSIPNGTYVDMCTNLPLVDPSQIAAPTLMVRGEFDGLASLDDLVGFFVRIPRLDKQFSVVPGIAHSSFHERNYSLVYHIISAFLEADERPTDEIDPRSLGRS